MRGVIREIRQQPEHIRELFLWVLVVMFFSVIGFTWFRSTEKRVVALLNPEQAEVARVLAEEKKSNTPTPFATIFSSFGELKANISDLFSGLPSEEFELTNRARSEAEAVPPQKLPLSEDK
ncbi:MAG: hypothetical protein WD898_01515 [Candidatus Paceibacterota bacterium]